MPSPDDLVYLRSRVHQTPRSRIPTWWRPNSAGYTYELFEAGLYRRAEAMEQCASSGKDNSVVEVEDAYTLDRPEHDFGTAMNMLAQDDPRDTKIMVVNPRVLQPCSGLFWDAGSYLKKATFHKDNTASETPFEIRPWWFGVGMHEWQIVPVALLKWRAQHTPALDPEKMARDAAAKAMAERTCPAGCLPAWSRGRNEIVFVNIAGDPCGSCGGTGKRRA